ncbi:inositol monophosphatase family protein [Gordonia liuliyuniae]|uniref:inositol-phosphate phosphatase n=1 Tax=Gordonia liuliyuniae TaxID=2911517 RepID=A0ABS9IUK4_9ACTN|nr:inositol monophosphatase [Gordonia liuliyuniae]MCF8589237.1 inositol monophosphatase [Gordonia liuliyuniae]
MTTVPASAADIDLPRLLGVADGILGSVVGEFVHGLGSPGSVRKKGDDFATDVDLSLERRIGAELVDRTGIGVHGEEYGGPAADSGPVWILDPIDGTFNYSVGLPVAAMLLALAVDGEPVLGITRLPLLNQHYTGIVGQSFTVNGEQTPRLEPGPLSSAVIGCGAFNVRSGGRYPGTGRAALYSALSHRARRLRMTGSTGTDMAYVAAGIFGGAVSFSYHAWDNAAGTALVRAAGGVATDVHGQPWRVGSGSLVTGDPQLHAELLEVIADSGVAGDDTIESKVDQ